MINRISILGAFALVLNSGMAWAHPGHGEFGAATAAHYLSDPYHGTVAIAALIAAVIAVGWLGRRVRRSGRLRATSR